MFDIEWSDYPWVIVIGVSVVLLILLDEFAYHHWRKANPGSLYSHLRDRTITPIDPSRPPTVYYE